jgi:hypothetical protein
MCWPRVGEANPLFSVYIALWRPAWFCLRSYDSAICLPFFKHLSRDYEKTTITTMYHGRWFAYKQTNKYLYCQSYTPVVCGCGAPFPQSPFFFFFFFFFFFWRTIGLRISSYQKFAYCDQEFAVPLFPSPRFLCRLTAFIKLL